MNFTQNNLPINTSQVTIIQQNFILIKNAIPKINQIKDKFDIICKRIKHQEYDSLSVEFVDIAGMIDGIIRDNELALLNTDYQQHYDKKIEIEFNNNLNMLKFISMIIEKCLEIFNIDNSSKYDNLVKEFQELAHKISEKYLYAYNKYHLDEYFWYRYDLYNYLKQNNVLEGFSIYSMQIFANIASEYDKYQKDDTQNDIQNINFPSLLTSCANGKLLFNTNKNKFYFDVLRNSSYNYLSYIFNDDRQAYAFMMHIEIEKLDNLCNNRANIISK